MKTALLKTVFALAAFAFVSSGVRADKGHDHKHEAKVVAGPKGGRILDNTSPKAEFFLEKDHTVTISFYDNELKPVAVTEQEVTVVAERKKIGFEKKGDVLVSREKLPEGDGYNVVVQFKQTADSRPQNHRFKLETHTCGDCKRAEYACSCHE